LKRLVAFFIGAALAIGCGEDGTPAQPTQPTPAMSALATYHLNELVGLMQVNSIKRLTIDWAAFRAAVFAEVPAAQTIPELAPAVRRALTLLGDGHSSYAPAAGGTSIFVSNRSCRGSGASQPVLPATIGYVKVTSFGGSGAAEVAFADQIQATIAAADRDNLIGWMVDLRGNGGGNMWPMIAGVGPLLGDGPLGYFIDPLNAATVWEYRDGASMLNGNAVTRVSSPYRLRGAQPRVAVMSDNGIASSGEATLIAFIGRPNTRSFGAATCGLSTANRTHQLTDGARLTLTNSVMADRARTPFGDSISPDEVVSDQSAAVQRAVEWLQSGR
jgi:carboxyl-terminal processing protease